MWLAYLLSPALLGKEGFQGCQQATCPQAVGESDTSVNCFGCQAKDLAHRVAQLLYTVNDFPVLLVSKHRQTKAISDSRTNEQTTQRQETSKPPHPMVKSLNRDIRNAVPNCSSSS